MSALLPVGVTGPPLGAVLGEVIELRRYPVKSMQGEALEALALDSIGVVGDRRWAVRDEMSGRLLQARTTRPLIYASARLVDGNPIIQLPDGAELAGTGRSTDRALSAWLGRAVRLVASEGDQAIGGAIELPTGAGFASWWEESRRSLGLRGALSRMHASQSAVVDGPAQVLELPSLPGSFNDCEPVHLVSASELTASRDLLPEASWDRRRFRPNVLVGDRDRGRDPTELAWVGWRVAIGDVQLEVTEPTLRCAMTTIDQPGLASDPGVLRALATARGAYFGRYARVVRGGSLRRGDSILYAGPGEAVDLELFARMRARSG